MDFRAVGPAPHCEGVTDLTQCRAYSIRNVLVKAIADGATSTTILTYNTAEVTYAEEIANDASNYTITTLLTESTGPSLVSVDNGGVPAITQADWETNQLTLTMTATELTKSYASQYTISFTVGTIDIPSVDSTPKGGRIVVTLDGPSGITKCAATQDDDYLYCEISGAGPYDFILYD
mmetsp:Transcript_24192/g.21279  ORF Transcript_24192/g.21279 Transcript_24192/m.21279 type:complete len:178 (+) Transcript_24192:717-1250(+)